jgi:hypothetical protein
MSSRVQKRRRLLDLRDESPTVQPSEGILDGGVMDRRVRLGLVVERGAQSFEGARDAFVLFVSEPLDRDTCVLGGDRDRGSVLVGPRKHEDVISGKTVGTRHDVGGDIRTRGVAEGRGFVIRHPTENVQKVFDLTGIIGRWVSRSTRSSSNDVWRLLAGATRESTSRERRKEKPWHEGRVST